MDGNTDIYPTTGMPTAMSMDNNPEDQAQAKEKARLEAVAKALALVESEKGSQVIALIKAALVKRIEVLVKQDEQCKAYMKLLSDINIQYAAAQAAVEKLAARNIGRASG